MTRWTKEPAFAYCAEVTRARAGNFYRGIRLLPDPQRAAMFVVYAWMREADDLVDASSDTVTARRGLDAFAQRTREVFDGGLEGEGHLWTALSRTCRAFELVQAPFEAMLDGQRWDLDNRSVETRGELERYCEQVASSVGMVCVRIWGCTGDEAMELARLRGLAFQLTNILRDVGEDMQRGRCYLPAEDMQGSLSRDALAAWHPPEACTALILNWCERAESNYRASEGLDRLIPRRCRATLVAMTSSYRHILRQIAARPARSVLGPRARLSTLSKVSLVARAALIGR
jgi:phytoene synthase